MTDVHVLVVAGARPNFMKVAPVLRQLAERGHDAELVHTGQHYDAAMSDVFFDELMIGHPDHHLGVGSGTHAVQTAAVMTAFDRLLADRTPDLVLVVGDVNSTVATALTAAKRTIPVGHVEAGLRSRDWTMPEEVNRVVTDRLSSLLFAPSPGAVDNLRAEGAADERIHLVGNVMIDTLLQQLPLAGQQSILADLGLDEASYVLVTMHRPANVDDPAVFAELLSAVLDGAGGRRVVFPAHPRVGATLDGLIARGVLGPDRVANLTILGPVGYRDSIVLQAGAALVATDSGGMQEETTALGIPCLTVRDNTERPITLTEGTNEMAGTDPPSVRTAVRRRLADPGVARSPALWDGRAAVRVVDAIEAFIAVGSPHPVD